VVPVVGCNLLAPRGGGRPRGRGSGVAGRGGRGGQAGGVPFLPRHVLEGRERRTALLYFCMMKPCALLMGD